MWIFCSITDGNRQSSLNSIFTGIANRVNSEKLRDDHQELMEIYEIPASTKATVNITMDANLEWLRKNSKIIKDFLVSYLNSSGKPFIMLPLIIGSLVVMSIL